MNDFAQFGLSRALSNQGNSINLGLARTPTHFTPMPRQPHNHSLTAMQPLHPSLDEHTGGLPVGKPLACADCCVETHSCPRRMRSIHMGSLLVGTPLSWSAACKQGRLPSRGKRKRRDDPRLCQPSFDLGKCSARRQLSAPGARETKGYAYIWYSVASPPPPPMVMGQPSTPPPPLWLWSCGWVVVV